MNHHFFNVWKQLLVIISLTLFSAGVSAAYYVHLGAFKTKANAQKLQHKIQAKMQVLPPHIHHAKTLYYVQIGPFAQLEDAKHAKVLATKNHINAFILSHNTKPKPSSQMPAQQSGHQKHADVLIPSKKNPAMIKDLPSNPQRFRWIASVSLGSAWSKAGDTETFFLTPTIEKSYRPSKNTTNMPNGELFFGVQKTLTSKLSGQLGLVLAMTGNARVDGIIWDDADPEFDNYSYRYKIRNTRIGIKGRALLGNYWLTPYVGGSVNIGFNRAYGFTNTPLIFEALPNSNFADSTKTALSYTLSAGLQKQLNRHWQTGIGYEFLDFGKSTLNRAPEQTLNSGLAMNHLYLHGISVHVTYVA